MDLFQHLLDALICCVLSLSVIPSINQSTKYGCLLLKSFSAYWLLFSLRIWTNVIAAVIHYQRILNPSSVHQKSKQKMIAIYVFLGSVASVSSYLAHFYRLGYDPSKEVCSETRSVHEALPRDRFILVRCFVILLVSSTFLFPIGTVIWIYKNLLKFLYEFEAPELVVAETEELLLREGYFLLWLTAPAHAFWLIELTHCKKEMPFGNLFVNGLTLISGSYCILNPFSHLIHTKRR